jgi:hypothetical protein
MTGPIAPKFKLNEFDYIIFHRRTGEPRAHGPTENAAWTALVKMRYPDGNLSIEQEFQERNLNRLDHVAVSCGENGAVIWAQRVSIDNVLAIIGGK